MKILYIIVALCLFSIGVIIVYACVKDRLRRHMHRSYATPSSELKTGANAHSETKKERLHVTGVSHYLGAILDMAIEDDEYTETKREICESHAGEDYIRIYQYFFDPVKVSIEPDPDNPEDENSLKVIVDGKHVGYIKKGSIPHVRKLLSGDKIVSMKAIIGGGKYREFRLDDETDRYEAERGEIPYSVKIEIETRV